RGLGLQPGDRVALLVPDVREYLEADYGIMATALVRVPLDPRATQRELAALVEHAGASALITHVALAEQAASLRERVRHLIVIGGGSSCDGLDYEALLAQASDAPPPAAAADDLASLNFSGGTTGAPKAAMLRQRNLLAVGRAVIDGFA